MQVQEQMRTDAVGACCPEPDSLFERCGWFYALCREHLFHDHSEEIGRCLWEGAAPPQGTHLLELGCGPGFYACRFAEKHPEIRTTGIDLSKDLLCRARSRAAQLHLTNCEFHLADVHALPASVGEVDVIVVSRLFLVVPNRNDVMREIFRVLRPGGKCFVAEPVSSARTQFPLSAMWLLAKLTSFTKVPYVEPHRVTTMTQEEFRSLVLSQDWGEVEFHRDGRYQHAVCTKPLAARASSPLGSAMQTVQGGAMHERELEQAVA